MDVDVDELSKAYGEEIQKENFLYSVPESEESSTSVQLDVENTINNEDQKNDCITKSKYNETKIKSR